MRQTLESSNKELIALDNEIVLLKTYLDIEKKRFQNRFDYTINISDKIESDITLIPPLLLQPFIENSIIHGLSSIEKGGLIILEFSEVNNELLCIVEDNGIGREASKNKLKYKKESLGINITKSRIDLMNKNSKNNIKIIDKDRGTRVEVTLPLELDL
jgi:LytS/YehU family sensor histidine kinase